MKTIYLDNAGTTRLSPVARAKMMEAMEYDLGNASALHSPGQTSKNIVETARENIARLLNAEPQEIIFTSGGTESNNTVMHTFAGKKVGLSRIEHPSVLESGKNFASKIQLLDVDNWGRVQLDSIPKDVDLVSVMLANNELGTIEPIGEVVKCCKKYNIPVHSDATQAFGKIKIDVKELGVDYLTISAHKIGGPTGIGALYVRSGAKFQPLLYGGHQEQGRRAGTNNTLAIAGFGAVAEWCWDNWSCKKWAKVAKLRDELKTRILAEVPYSSCNSPTNDCLPNILNMSFQASEGESIQLYLDAEGIVVGTGSACATGDLKPSHVIMATKNDAEVAHNSLRFSLGLETTKADLNRVMEVLPGIIKRLQSISTVSIKEKL